MQSGSGGNSFPSPEWTRTAVKEMQQFHTQYLKEHLLPADREKLLAAGRKIMLFQISGLTGGFSIGVYMALANGRKRKAAEVAYRRQMSHFSEISHFKMADGTVVRPMYNGGGPETFREPFARSMRAGFRSGAGSVARWILFPFLGGFLFERIGKHIGQQVAQSFLEADQASYRRINGVLKRGGVELMRFQAESMQRHVEEFERALGDGGDGSDVGGEDADGDATPKTDIWGEAN